MTDMDDLLRSSRMKAAHSIADKQGGVVSRRQLYTLGFTRWQVRAELRGRRWQAIGDRVVVLHNGPVSDEGHLWAAVIIGGPRAQLDGAAALVASGLERYKFGRVRVSVPRGARVGRRTSRYDIRQTRRWSADHAAPTGIPRTRPAVDAVREALWAKTNRQAAYVLTLVVQQGLARPEELAVEALQIQRDRRRLFVQATVNDLLDGARALGELDVARELKRRGLPLPAKQVLRKDKSNRYYLDLYWPELKLVVEIDGIHHAWAENVVGDALRQNSLAISGDTVLRVPLLGLRIQPDDFYGQIEEAITAALARLAA